jgi:hypothetical protein
MRLGTALSNVGASLLVCSALCFLGTMIFPLLVGINFIVAIVIVVVTLGLILLEYPFSTFIIFNLDSAGELAPNFGTTDGSNNGFLEIYNVNTNANESLIEKLETSLDINYEYNEIEYVFKYIVDVYNQGESIDDTLITLTCTDLPTSTGHPWVSVVYQYYQVPLKNADNSDGVDVEPNWSDSSWSTGANNPNDTTVMNFSGRNDAGVYTQIQIDATYPICYVRCYCIFDVAYESEEYSNLFTNNTSNDISDNSKTSISDGYYYGYNWRFTLKFAEQIDDNI